MFTDEETEDQKQLVIEYPDASQNLNAYVSIFHS